MSLVVMGGMGANCDGTCVGGRYLRKVRTKWRDASEREDGFGHHPFTGKLG